jgi:hypothetical protein
MTKSIPTITFIKQEEELPLGGWNCPTTPLPPTLYNAHDDIYWSFCYDAYYTTHLDTKQDNYYFPGAGSANQVKQHLNPSCNSRMKHDPEFDAVIKAKYLNIRKACRAWGRGKRVCYNCRFVVNIDRHGELCSTVNNI